MIARSELKCAVLGASLVLFEVSRSLVGVSTTAVLMNVAPSPLVGAASMTKVMRPEPPAGTSPRSHCQPGPLGDGLLERIDRPAGRMSRRVADRAVAGPAFAQSI